MKVAFVVQRYGDGLIGGAESLCKQIAENLALALKWEIDIYTTTAKDYRSWKNIYPPGEELQGKITVQRFDCRFPRWLYLFQVFNRCFSSFLTRRPRHLLIQKLQAVCENLWFALQGPYCPELITALHAQARQYEKIFFFTYLYYPTVYGLEAVSAKAVLVPSVHDEKPLYFSRVQQLFAKAQQILVNCEAEKSLILAKTAANPAALQQAGIGIDHLIEPGLVPRSAKVEPLEASPQRPYLLFLGRLCKGKGVLQLIEGFLHHQAKHGASCDLYLAGTLEKGFRVPAHPSIHSLGVVSEQAKVALLRQAVALVNPSPHESLSLIVLEALALKVPVLVNAANPVLKAYTRSNPSVFAYHEKQDFSAYVSYLLSAAWREQVEEQLALSQAWVRDEYSWRKIVAIYEKTLQTPKPCLPQS